MQDNALAVAWLRGFARAVEEDEDRLTALDSAIGDGDHGINMRRGTSHVHRMLLRDGPSGTMGELLDAAGRLLRTHVGGAAGALYGSTFQAMGAALPDGRAGLTGLGDALQEGLTAVVRLGAAAPGDKTMVDAYTPAVAAFREACAHGRSLGEAATAAAEAAAAGARSTVSMQARKGRASYLGYRSVGHLDPGAVSTGMLFRALAEEITNGPEPALFYGRIGCLPGV
ncbi:dihydroxyacetone kinase subunit DhaL [Streptomyces tanashiensis]|jgi:dihydroxyacetone kinase-like protein|uniref:Dihydroxyacetone kinase subunit L n=1 Tax=Streptomyces tanashiensis TaxID=67367 RepID=A0ABY6QTZ4_9ACTN|nr:dihydroxyacetone kinase subunit DhaL [Streptomyces tanashiensis]UZX20493.1 dihydroxyacetone kinase subunit L [Streptomyces tanashiensis]GGY46749.1 dihydroxyacetone kinase subunit L [Streptomyces tanashiensis]